MKRISILVVALLCNFSIWASDTTRVLFIGNSYTGVNNLPELVKQVAASEGHTLIYGASNPGGQTLQQHLSNTTTLNLIQQGNWDFVVLQEQSQLPSFPDPQVNSDFFPYAVQLDSLVHEFNSCAKTLFYITWGRKNGDPNNCPYFPPLCTYAGMDSLLTLRYTEAAQMTNAWLSPVGPLWHQLRINAPQIELYQVDESHPTVAGSYAAALSFYAMIYQTDVQNVSFNATLTAGDAAQIRNQAQELVSDSLDYWKRFAPSPIALFTYDTPDPTTFSFSNLSENADSYFWNFGDGETSTDENPVHNYNNPGTFNVCLTAVKGCDADTFCMQLDLTTGITAPNGFAAVTVFPNPVHDFLKIKGLDIPVDYQVVDVLGRVWMKDFITDDYSLSVQSLPTGVYYLHIVTEAGLQKSFRFLKN